MSKREIIAVILVATLGGWFAVYFTDWFRSPPMLILLAPARRLSVEGQALALLPAFDLVEKRKLTSVKVVPLVGGKFSRLTPPAWHLVSKSNSVPIKGFVYGSAIPGMQPGASNSPVARPLQPNQPYRLLVEAGALKGALDFQAGAAPANGQ